MSGEDPRGPARGRRRPFPGLAEAGVAATLGGGARSEVQASWDLGLWRGPRGPDCQPEALPPAWLVSPPPPPPPPPDPAGEMAEAKGTTSLPTETFGADSPSALPPPQLPPLGAGLGTVDEGDSLDGQNTRRKEVAPSR